MVVYPKISFLAILFIVLIGGTAFFAEQVSYKQARTYTHEAFQAAGNFFSHLSTAISPPSDAL